MARDIIEKINAAKKYVEQNINGLDMTEIKNDAANIFAESYEDYMSIWEALQ